MKTISHKKKADSVVRASCFMCVLCAFSFVYLFLFFFYLLLFHLMLLLLFLLQQKQQQKKSYFTESRLWLLNVRFFSDIIFLLFNSRQFLFFTIVCVNVWVCVCYTFISVVGLERFRLIGIKRNSLSLFWPRSVYKINNRLWFVSVIQAEFASKNSFCIR